MAEVQELAFKSNVGEYPLFFYATDTPLEDVEAVLIDEHGQRHDMIEFEETPPDEQGRWGRRVGARVPTPFWATGDYTVEWTVDGEVAARYSVQVRPHPTVMVDGRPQLQLRGDELRRFAALSTAEQRTVSDAFLKGA